jgi:hypothetical protein
MQITVNIFATADEIHAWFEYHLTRFDLHFALIKHWPDFDVIPLPDWQTFKEQAVTLRSRELWIDLKPLSLGRKGQFDCGSKNRDRLGLDLPEMRPEGMCQGNLGTLSEDEAHLKVWRSIMRYFRKQTTSGMWVMNPDSKARGFYKDLRYSAGIAELHRRGLQLLTHPAGNLVFIDEPR